MFSARGTLLIIIFLVKIHKNHSKLADKLITIKVFLCRNSIPAPFHTSGTYFTCIAAQEWLISPSTRLHLVTWAASNFSSGHMTDMIQIYAEQYSIFIFNTQPNKKSRMQV